MLDPLEDVAHGFGNFLDAVEDTAEDHVYVSSQCQDTRLNDVGLRLQRQHTRTADAGNRQKWPACAGCDTQTERGLLCHKFRSIFVKFNHSIFVGNPFHRFTQVVPQVRYA